MEIFYIYKHYYSNLFYNFTLKTLIQDTTLY